MRGVLLLSLCLVAAGCGSKGKSTAPSLAASTIPRDNRVDAFQLWQEGYGQKATPDKHPLDGKPVLVKFSDLEAATDGDGKPVLIYGAEKGKYRPAIVARLSDTTGYAAGETLTNAYVEGHLKGCVPIATESWATPWLKIPQQKGLPQMHIILIENAKVVLPPQD
jgi:hypothetical protein